MTDFSVIVPLYNKRPHIERALQSIFAQTLPAREVIIIDDGSTDGSRDYVQAMDDERVKLILRNQPGPGGYAARNAGIGAASGEWIAFLDADDVWMSGHLRALSDAISRVSEPVGCAFSRWEIVEDDKNLPPYIPRDTIAPHVTLSLDDILSVWLKDKYCPIWTGVVAIRKTIFETAGLFPEGRALRGGDKDMWLRAIAAGKSVHTPEVTAEFHQDAVNRVTKRTNHRALPIINSSIADILERTPDPHTRRQLKHIANHELVNYARFVAGARQTVPLDFARSLYMPEGAMDALKLGAYMAAGSVLQFTSPSKDRVGAGNVQ
ncbi:glycosyltransferase family 2 protein [Pelagibacterium luteolum]|uniref:Glycosyl transferase family 2 n=1 Tax=Pelagibacterium luteolum TaxID=440168 RepID=A0A1G7S392_9HYPH|nr:glycosyltransferase family A protein [Pelagibacterium luteolum]SDG16919.1 Glycosyl transferase family 2 [Pelagibacterium luteolum]